MRRSWLKEKTLEYLDQTVPELKAENERLRAALKIHHPRGLPMIGDCTYDREGTGASGMASYGCPENRSDSDPVWWCQECRVRAALKENNHE